MATSAVTVVLTARQKAAAATRRKNKQDELIHRHEQEKRRRARYDALPPEMQAEIILPFTALEDRVKHQLEKLHQELRRETTILVEQMGAKYGWIILQSMVDQFKVTIINEEMEIDLPGEIDALDDGRNDIGDDGTTLNERVPDADASIAQYERNAGPKAGGYQATDE
jgi:hypothetical protein